MSISRCSATVRTLSNFTELNVRSGPGTHYELAFKIPVGTADAKVVEVQPDERGVTFQNKLYQWFRLEFPDGRIGWMRDDLIDIAGACAPFGYGELAAPTHGFTLRRQVIVPVVEGEERVRKAAFNITAGFEGGGYATYQNTDSGIVSYGRFQYTLSSGNLFTLLNRYIGAAQSPTALQLRDRFLQDVMERDAILRNDADFRTLLIQAASDPVMQKAQDDQAVLNHWNPTLDMMCRPRGVKTPLGLALIFDMAINHGKSGTEKNYLSVVEETLGVPNKSKLGENGVREEDFIRRVAEARRNFMYRFANKHNLPGLKPRGDFWVNLIAAGDWTLMGNDAGLVTIKQGRAVQVRNP
jgi:hypothetical protein